MIIGVERKKMNKSYVRYQDDGPSGACGQSVSNTMPWDILYVFNSPDDADQFCKNVSKGRGRKNVRVTARWDDFLEQNVRYFKGER